TTFQVAHRIRAILRPGSAQEVQACVRVANQTKIPLYPVSGGRNWGMGSRAPSADGCVLLDLSRLNRIVEFDEKFAYMTVEPGVTFRQAYEYLCDRTVRLYLPGMGGPDAASLIGNVLERGDGRGPYGDRALHVCGAEVVLPDGEMIHLGFARFPGARVAPLARWGVGPHLDGLFTQSNLGIVTRMSFWLAPVAEHYATFFTTISSSAALGGFLDAMRPLVLRDIVQPGCLGVWNAYKTLASEGRYPWTAMGGKTPLNLTQLSRRDTDPWFASGTVLAWSEDHLKSLSDLVQQSFSASDVRVTLMPADQGARQDIRSFPLSVPDMQTVRSTYWRKKTEVPENPDPDRDRCGVMWICPLFPFDGALIASAMPAFETVYRKFDFEPNVGMCPTSGRSMHVYLALMYDRDVPGEDERAMACQNELHQLALQLGCPPYRLGIQSMSVPGGDASYVRLLRQMKRALDPNDILAPGRYDWRHEWPDD
ncbi:MAG TPA: FAD-binding oxidoreductase, partial [Burkholderiales bacterium]|nr:FAD-binding oxidoreductase [Burkholderiales bacterium]